MQLCYVSAMFHRYVYNFLVNYDSIDTDAILDIQKYLMKKNSLK